jgi:hypothetical protein
MVASDIATYIYAKLNDMSYSSWIRHLTVNLLQGLTLKINLDV